MASGKFIYKIIEKYLPTGEYLEEVLNNMSDNDWEYVNTIIPPNSATIKIVFRRYIPNKKIDTETI